MAGLINLVRDGGRLQEALTLTDQIKDYTRRAGLGPWTQLSNEAQRLEILQNQGRSEEVLSAVHDLRQTMVTLPEQSDAPETAISWNVREAVLDIGRRAALDLEHWQEALALNAELLESTCRRAAPHLERTRARSKRYAPLLHLGRLEEAKQVLLDCRHVYEDERDIASLGRVLGELAALEATLSHPKDAIRLVQDALRLGYVANEPDDIAVSHFNLANYVQQAGQDAAVALAHRLASAVIWFQMDSGKLTSTLRGLAGHLASFDGDPPLPASFADLCRLVEQVDGVHFAQLVERLPKRAPDGEAALAEVIRLARELG